MNPGTLQTICQIFLCIGIIVTALAGFGSYHYGEKAAALESKKLQKKQQTTIAKLDELLESTNNDNKTKLLERYPAGYVLFGIGPSGTFSSSAFPHEKGLLEEYEFDWSNVKIEELTLKSLTILLPNIRYKPLNSQLIGISMTINRRPCGKEYMFPVKLKGANHRIFLELLKDNNYQLIFVVGFRKIVM